MEGELSHRVEDQMYFSFDVCGNRALCLSYPEVDEDDFTYIFSLLLSIFLQEQK